MMRRIADQLITLLYPPDCTCLACNRPLVEDVPRQLCSECAQALTPIEGARCPVCGRPEAHGRTCESCAKAPIETRVFCTAPYLYDGVAQQLVHTLKFSYVRAAAIPLAMGMAEAMPTGYDMMVPVPLHEYRLRIRGFNQARLLCEALAERGAPPIYDALVRVRETRKQSQLSAQERRKNPSGAFELAEPVLGKRILLVDDVRTTGATISACAQVLYASGALEVRAWTATVTPSHPHSPNSTK